MTCDRTHSHQYCGHCHCDSTFIAITNILYSIFSLLTNSLRYDKILKVLLLGHYYRYRLQTKTAVLTSLQCNRYPTTSKGKAINPVVAVRKITDHRYPVVLRSGSTDKSHNYERNANKLTTLNQHFSKINLTVICALL